jgi:hypothetical protein
MLRLLQLAVLGLGLAFFLALAGLAYYSSTPATPNEQQSAAQTSKEQPDKEQHTLRGFINFLFPDAISIFTFWLVIATIVLAAVALTQIKFLRRAETIAAQAANAAKQSADIADRSLKILQRAFVFPGQVHIRSHLDTATKKIWWSFHPTWGNSGNSPTRNLRINVNRWLETKELPNDFNFPSKGESIPTLIGPHGTIGSDPITVQGDELVRVQKGELYFYIWGWAKYRDVFPDTQEHVTRFAYRVTLLGDPTKHAGAKNIVEPRFDLFPRFNCSDEECENQGYGPDK